MAGIVGAAGGRHDRTQAAPVASDHPMAAPGRRAGELEIAEHRAARRGDPNAFGLA
jgi:hypothetical protein